MLFIGGLVAGLFIGGIAVMILMCAVSAGKEADDTMEKYWNEVK